MRRLVHSLSPLAAAAALALAAPAAASAAGPPDLWKVAHGPTGSGKTEVHVMDGASNFGSFLLNWPSADGHNQTESSVEYVTGDFNTDGKVDLWKVAHGPTASGKTEVHILNGANRFESFLLNWPTADGHNQNDSAVEYVAGDFNNDGRTDLWKVAHGSTGSGRTEVHILNGADNFQSFLLNWPTADGPNQSDSQVEYVAADYNKDGRTDLWKVGHGPTGSGRTEVHILNGADNFQSFLVHAVSADGPNQTDSAVEYAAADYNGDGRADLWKVAHGSTASGKTEVHVMNGANEFGSFLGHPVTTDSANQTDSQVEYAGVDYDGPTNPPPPPPHASCSSSGFSDSFEYDPLPEPSCWNPDKLLAGDATVTRTTAVSSAHSSAMQSELGPTGDRAEIQCHRLEYGCAGGEGTEFTYEYDFRVPSGFTVPSSRPANIAQTKPTAPTGTRDCFGGGLQVQQDASNAGRVKAIFASRAGDVFTDANGFCDVTEKRDDQLGSFTKDQWHRFKLHVRWSVNSSVGFIEAWIDGQPVIARRSQRTMLNGSGRTMMFRLGLYETLNTARWRAYYDNVVIRKH